MACVWTLILYCCLKPSIALLYLPDKIIISLLGWIFQNFFKGCHPKGMATILCLLWTAYYTFPYQVVHRIIFTVINSTATFQFFDVPRLFSVPLWSRQTRSLLVKGLARLWILWLFFQLMNNLFITTYKDSPNWR